MSHSAEVVSRTSSGCAAALSLSPCPSNNSAIPAPCTGLMSTGATNSSCSEHPLSDSGAAALVQPQISGSVADFDVFLSETSNLDWVLSAFPVEHGHSDRNIFVSKLPASFKDADLLAMFQSFGQVLSAKVMLNVKTGVSKETGFVQFASSHDAVKARAFLRLRPTGVTTTPPMPDVLTQWAQNKHDGGLYGERCQQVRKLFIRNVPVSVSQADMRAFVSRFGEVTDVSVHSDTYEASPNQSANRSRRTQPASSSEVAQSAEAEAGEGSSMEVAEHETIICFVTFLDPAAALRACREIHSTTPFAACDGVPLMAKLAEDNGTRHARRQNGSMATAASAAAGAAPLCGPWTGFGSLHDGQSGFSSEAATPLTNTVGSGYHRGNQYAPTMAVPSYTSGAMTSGNTSGFSGYAMPPPPPPPMLSPQYLNNDFASPYNSQASTPQYSPHSNNRSAFGPAPHSPGIPAPRRAVLAHAQAQGAPTFSAGGTTGLSTPSVVSLAPRPNTVSSGELVAQQHQTTPLRARRAQPPLVLSLDVTPSTAGNGVSTVKAVPTPAAMSFAGVVIPATMTSMPPSPQHANVSRGSRRGFADSSTSLAAPRSYTQTQQGCGAAAMPPAPLSPMLSQPATSLAGSPLAPQQLPRVSPMQTESGAYYQPQQYLPQPDSCGPAAAHHASLSISSEAVQEHDEPRHADQRYSAATPMWQRRMDRPTTLDYAATAAMPVEVPQLSSCAAYGTPLSLTPTAGWDGVSPMRAKTAAPSPHSGYAHTTEMRSGSQATTPCAGATRYRNNPYGMRLMHSSTQEPSNSISS